MRYGWRVNTLMNNVIQRFDTTVAAAVHAWFERRFSDGDPGLFTNTEYRYIVLLQRLIANCGLLEVR